MITNAEIKGILNYLEFLLVKEFLEPIIDKHVYDPDVIDQSYDRVYEILNELEREIANHRNDTTVALTKNKK